MAGCTASRVLHGHAAISPEMALRLEAPISSKSNECLAA